jgi:hypothetical protein
MDEIFKIPPVGQVKAEIERRRQEIVQLKGILKIARAGPMQSAGSSTQHFSSDAEGGKRDAR